ncbi:hypothetical protein PG996_001604 [Apiospora saccharicola]|uniref:Adenylate kinase n=1 Tax=Apiospora saccharicola TaxID=335842 RepID=A0ABR1WH94_9PEZI
MNSMLSLGQRFISASHSIKAIWLSFSLGVGLHHLWCALQNKDGLGNISQAFQQPGRVQDYRGLCKDQKPLVILILGAPGVGKGTQSAYLASTFGLAHLSYGDLMRKLSKDQASVVSTLPIKPVSKWMESASSVQPVIYLFAPFSVSASRISGRAAGSGRPEDADLDIIGERLDRYCK